MKRALKRLTAWLLCAVMLVVPLQLSPVTASTQTTMPMLAYVPLDNRPVVYQRVQYAAGAAGFDIRVPDEDLFRTLLDGQGGTGPYGSQHGDGAAIMDWLDEMEAAGCDHYIIHLDQMFSGGLVGSRHPDSAAVTDEELDIMERLLALNADADNTVYFIDIVMRLASTGSYKGYGLDQYSALRTWGAEERYVMDAAAFSTMDYDTSVALIDEIESYYRISTDGATEIAYDTTALTEANVEEYLSFRKRKLTLMNMMIQNMGAGTTYLVGVDDSSPGNTIQTNELNFLDARMKATELDYTVMSDTDSIGLMAVARCVNDYYQTRPTLQVRYFGNGADLPADDYAHTTLRECIDSHIQCLNAQSVSDDGEVEVLVLTRPDASFSSPSDAAAVTYAANVNALIAQANANIAADKPTIIIEASDVYGSAWGYGCTNLQDELLENVDITKLLGYSNWNTVGNSTGIALGIGVSRYTYLRYADSISEDSHMWNLKSMAYSYAKDIAYNARNKLNYWAPNAAQSFHVWLIRHTENGTLKESSTTNDGNLYAWSDSNFYTDMDSYDGTVDGNIAAGEAYVNAALTAFMMGTAGEYVSSYETYTGFYGDCEDIIALLEGGAFYSNLNRTVQTVAIRDVSLDNFRFPWHRHFEIIFDIDGELGDAATYYSLDSTLVGQIPVGHTASVFKSQATEQFGTVMSLIDLNGAQVADDAVVGTGFTVIIMSATEGSTVTYQTVVKGDIDGDGAAATADVRQIMKCVLGTVNLSAAQSAAADSDDNGKITSTDARQFLQDCLRTV